uniref:Uncharacterized protein n=1 Tax=Rhodococcus sp. NS1 TaxID=402236 RepID=A0A097SQL9_9NOCA|nr:hypothetical protein LRS1606.378 [Rhodococcus sp. NS1]
MASTRSSLTPGPRIPTSSWAFCSNAPDSFCTAIRACWIWMCRLPSSRSPRLPTGGPVSYAVRRRARGQLAGAGRTVRTSARLLYDVLTFVYDRLGFDILDDAVFQDLVIARIVEPTSKTDALRVLDDLGADPMSCKTIQRHLTQVIATVIVIGSPRRCFEFAAETGGLGLSLFDVTTLYFEAEKEATCARSATRKSAGSIRRSWSICSSTALGSRWRSAVSKATRPKPTPWFRSCARSRPATDRGRGDDHRRRRRHAVGIESVRPGRGGPEVQRRLAGHEGAR